MIVFESRSVRRIVGRLERGESVREAVVGIVRARGLTTAWLRAIGHLEWAEVRRFDERARKHDPAERIEAPCRVVALEGNVSYGDGGEPSVRLEATLVREGAGGAVTFGGELVDAGVFDLELVMECYDDLGLRRERDADTGLDLWSGVSTKDGAPARPSSVPELRDRPRGPAPVRDREPAPAIRDREPSPVLRDRDHPGQSPAAVSWQQAAALAQKPAPAPPKPGMGRRSVLTEAREPAPVPDPIPEKRKIDPDELLAEPIPEQGDYVEHQVFGLCRVEGEDAEGGIIIRLPSGVRKHINLDVLEVRPGRVESDRIVYPVRPRRR
jgi:predicted DNA-binding protein with PD1-like motif